MNTEKFVHDMGIPFKDTVREFERIISNLGLEIVEKIEKDNKLTIIAKKGENSIKMIFRPQKPKVMGIQRTIVEIFCSREIHEQIQQRIRVLRCGG